MSTDTCQPHAEAKRKVNENLLEFLNVLPDNDFELAGGSRAAVSQVGSSG